MDDDRHAPYRTLGDRLDAIERRLSRIEGGLVLAGFLTSAAVVILATVLAAKL